MNQVYKDYIITKGGVLVKKNLNEGKHLLWKFGGVPCIDAVLWEKYGNQIKRIEFSTNKKRTFKVPSDVFSRNKKEINYGFGRQYYIPLEDWDITDPNSDKELSKLSQLCL